MKVTRSILKQLILETMDEAPTGTSSGTPTQSAGDGELARLDAAAVAAAAVIINKTGGLDLSVLSKFNNSTSTPGEGDKDAFMYTELMAKAMELQDLDDTVLASLDVADEAQALKDAAFEAHAIVADTRDDDAEPDLQTTDY